MKLRIRKSLLKVMFDDGNRRGTSDQDTEGERKLRQYFRLRISWIAQEKEKERQFKVTKEGSKYD